MVSEVFRVGNPRFWGLRLSSYCPAKTAWQVGVGSFLEKDVLLGNAASHLLIANHCGSPEMVPSKAKIEMGGKFHLTYRVGRKLQPLMGLEGGGVLQVVPSLEQSVISHLVPPPLSILPPEKKNRLQGLVCPGTGSAVSFYCLGLPTETTGPARQPALMSNTGTAHWKASLTKWWWMIILPLFFPRCPGSRELVSNLLLRWWKQVCLVTGASNNQTVGLLVHHW